MTDMTLENLDMRIGKVVEANEHPNADKLIVLNVSLGQENRQLCAGLKEHYTLEEFVGKHIVVVCNLKPAKLRGIMSEGMLLAASEGDAVSLLLPPEGAETGTQLDGTTQAKQMEFPEFLKFQLEVGPDGNAGVIIGEQFIPFTVNGKYIGTDKNLGSGAKIK